MNAPYHNKALPEGSMLREWRLERVLGVGGFGIVYRGRGQYFDELVAIKEYFPNAISDRLEDTTVAPSDSSSEEIYGLGLQKFLEEAKVLWNLSKPERHPNIVSVRSLFEAHGTAYMVMDFETGVSLSQLLKSGHRFKQAELMGIIKPIAEGLDRAHRAGVLHRDIKPANILVDDSGRPVLIDFGSARFDSGQATSTKVTFFTPPYAALEQYVKTYPQGPWTDIYALGVTLYECVVGEKPPEVLERLHGELGEPLAARDWPGFTPAFLRAVDAAMAPKPADRPQSIPQWLRQFDGPVAPADDDATRIMTAPAAAPPAAPVVALPAAPQAATAESLSQPRPRGKAPLLAIAAAVGAVVLGGGAFAVLSALKPPPTQVEAAAPVAAPANAAAVADFSDDLGALLADAQRLERPQEELAALTKARDQAAALSVQARAAPAAAREPLITDINRQAAAAAALEAAALNRDADAMLRDVAGNPAWQGRNRSPSTAVAAIVSARKALQTALALTREGDPTQAITGARQALAAHRTFAEAFVAARRVFIAAQIEQTTRLEAAGRQAGAAVSAAAAGPKPWALATRATKDRYKLLQENAARAKVLEGELSAAVSAAKAAGTLKAVNAAAASAASARASLTQIEATTAAVKASGAK